MKKFLFLTLSVILLLGLVACGESETSDAESDEASATEEKESKEAGDETEVENTNNEENKEDGASGDVIESEAGKLTIVKQNKELDKVENSGPMELTISAIQMGKLEVHEAYTDMFEEDKLTVITVQMKAENTSENNISFYPDQAVLTTNAGDQVDAEMLFSDSVGGDFFGPTNKKGDVAFLLETDPSEIDSVKLIINGAHDENFENVGENLEIELDF